MTIYSNNVKQFSIYLAKVDFPDKPGIYKVRPVLVLDEIESMVVALKMTTNRNSEFSTYELRDWREAGLDYETSVILDPLQYLLPENIFVDKYIGDVSDYDLDNILNLL